RRADVREDERRLDVGRELAQVAVVPGGLDAVEDRGRVPVSVPADPEPVAVRLLGAEARVQALDDERVLRAVEQLFEERGRPEVGEPAAHASVTLAPRPAPSIVRSG